jgi:hypothetical protein
VALSDQGEAQRPLSLRRHRPGLIAQSRWISRLPVLAFDLEIDRDDANGIITPHCLKYGWNAIEADRFAHQLSGVEQSGFAHRQHRAESVPLK